VGAAAYAGIPVTQRDFTTTVTFITGHEHPEKEVSDMNWSALAQLNGTMVFYMGVKNLPHIVNNLMDNGCAKDTPIALIQQGTYNKQKTVTGTLETIVRVVEETGIKPPAIIVVGKVVALREQLQWFDNRPLYGKRIVVTRSRTQASSLTKQLRNLGAEVVELPTIHITPVEDFTELHDAIHHIKNYNWIIFTSTNSVDIFFKQLFALKKDVRHLHGVKIAVIGGETAKQVNAYGITPDVMPTQFTSEGTIESLKQLQSSYKDVSFLIPGSNIARDYIPVELQKMGASVRSISIYNNNLPDYSSDFISDIFATPVDLVTFTSSSTVLNFIEILQQSQRMDLIGCIVGASIGPVTSATANEHNVAIVCESAPHTIDALVQTILQFFNKNI